VYTAVHPLIRLKLHAQVLIDHVLIRILEESDIKLVNIETLNTGRLSLCPVHITGNSTLSPWRRPDIISGFDRTPTLSENANVFIPSDLQRCFIDSGSYVTLPLTESHTCGRTLFRVDCTDCHSVLPVDCLERLVGNDFRAKRDPEIIRHDLDVSLIDTIPDISIIDEGLAESITMSLGLHGFVIYGQNGSGKTHLALMHATVSHLREGRGTIYLDCRKLRETKDLSLQNLLQEIVQVFKDATSLPSCTVILDDLDQIVLSVETTSDSNESSRMQQINPATVQHSKLISDTLFHAIKYARTKLKGQVCVIATCDSPHSIPSEIFKLIGDENAVLVPQLSAHNRVNLFVKILQSRSIHVCPSGRLSVSRITEEYRARDIRNLALRVAKKLECALPNALTEFGEILNEEITNYVPMSQISALVERVDLSSSWTEIGGLFRAKQALFETIIRPSIYPRIYANSKVRQPSGILLFGPPGAGKTCIVPALAKKCGYRLVTCRGPELLDKYIGASEANVRNLFARAASVAPSILFLDELDALAPRRGSDNTGVTDRIVNQLLTFLDGVEDVSANKVYVVAATSRPDKVDPALLRPGRLERHIYLGYPSLHEAEDIISKIALRYTLTNETSEIIQDGSLVRQLTGTAFSRLSPADLKGAFDRANVDAIRQSLTEGKDSEAIQISADKVVKALASCQPSLSEGEIERLLSCYASFRGLEKRGSDGLVEMPGSDGSHLRAALK
jgi:peroxin-1